jgi:hypothetical protein
MTMDATQIGTRLASKGLTAAECHPLVLACGQRRDAIRERLAAIAPSRSMHLPQPAERAAALAKSPAAVVDLDREVELLRVEFAQLDHLEGVIHAREVELRLEDLRRAYPQALRAVPRQVEALERAMASFDAAVAALQTTFLTIAERCGLPDGEQLPFDDDALVGLLELRNRVWTPRVISPPHQIPDIAREEIDDRIARFPKSWELVYERRGYAVAVRRPPREQSAFFTLAGD